MPWLRIQSSASRNHLAGLCGGKEPSALRRHLGRPPHLLRVTHHNCLFSEQAREQVCEHACAGDFVQRVRGECCVGRSRGDVGPGSGEAALAVAGAHKPFIERAQVEIRLWEVLHTSFLPYGCNCSCWGTPHASTSYFNFSAELVFHAWSRFSVSFWVTHLSLQEHAQDGRICGVAGRNCFKHLVYFGV